MSQVAFALALLAGAAGTRSPEAAALLEQAAAALEAVRTVEYRARLEVRSEDAGRLVSGEVRLQKIDYTDPVGGLVAVSGEIHQPPKSPEAFVLSYDGTTVFRHVGGSGVVLQSDSGYGGERLLEGNFGALILQEFLAARALEEERASEDASAPGRDEIDGAACDVVEVRLGGGARTVRWHLDAATHLPVRREIEFLSARGRPVTSALTLSALRVNPDLAPALFRYVPPAELRIERMGRRPPEPFNIGEAAPNWMVLGEDGRRRTLAEYRGRLVVMDFWASWCPYCQRAMPALQRLHDEYADRGVAILGLNCRERSQIDPVAFVREQGFDYPVFPGDELAVLYRVQGLPAFYVIGPDGTLLHRSSGFNKEAEAALLRLIGRYVAGEL